MTGFGCDSPAALLIQVAVGASARAVRRVEFERRKTVGLNLDDKKAVVAEVSAQVANAQSIIVAEYRGLEWVDLTALRAKARESGVYLRVLKNTLVRRAIAGTPFEGLTGKLTGPLIYGISARIRSRPPRC
jgi:ribosomal protein L10